MAEVVFEPAYVPDKFRQIQKKFAEAIGELANQGGAVGLSTVQACILGNLASDVMRDYKDGPTARALVKGQKLRRSWIDTLVELLHEEEEDEYTAKWRDHAEAAAQTMILGDIQELARRANLLDGRLKLLTHGQGPEGTELMVTVVEGIKGTPTDLLTFYETSDAEEPLDLILLLTLCRVGLGPFEMFMDTTPRIGGKLNA